MPQLTRPRTSSPTSGGGYHRPPLAPPSRTWRSVEQLMLCRPAVIPRYSSPMFAPEPMLYSLTLSPPSRSSHPKEPEVCCPPSTQIDHEYFPHIMDRIIAEVDWDVLLALRATCRKYHDKVHAMQTRQLIFFPTSSAPQSIRSPTGRVPSLMLLHGSSIHDVLFFSSTRVIEFIGCPLEHRAEFALQLAFEKRNLTLRFHPTSHLHDVEEPVAARKVVTFGTSMKSGWKELPPDTWAQEKTVINVKDLNQPHDLAAVFKRFPPSSGSREAVLVFTHWGVDMGYSVPMSMDHVFHPELLAEQRLDVLTTLVAGMILGEWLFPNMPPVKFTIVDIDTVPVGNFSPHGEGPLSKVLFNGVLEKVTAMVEDERPGAVAQALGRLNIVTMDEYATTLDPEDLVLETVQMRYTRRR